LKHEVIVSFEGNVVKNPGSEIDLEENHYEVLFFVFVFVVVVVVVVVLINSPSSLHHTGQVPSFNLSRR